MMLEEDENVSRIQETLDVFKMITSSRFLSGIPIMLFLNKRDIFEEKIKINPLTIAFPKYKGEPGDWKAAADCTFIIFHVFSPNFSRVRLT